MVFTINVAHDAFEKRSPAPIFNYNATPPQKQKSLYHCILDMIYIDRFKGCDLGFV